MDDLASAAQAFSAYAPHAMLAAGVALLMVPRWLRFSIAIALIMFGLVGIWPELLGEVPAATQAGR